MSLMDDAARDVYRVRPVEVLDGRDIVNSWDAPGTHAPARVIIQPVTGREDSNGNRDATLAQFSVIDQDSPPDWWRDTDRLEMDGIQYQIEGHVQDWPHPIPHAYFLINRWEG